MERDAIDLGSVNVFKLFNKYFIPTLLGMLSMSAVTAIDGIFVGHGVGSDGRGRHQHLHSRTDAAHGRGADAGRRVFRRGVHPSGAGQTAGRTDERDADPRFRYADNVSAVGRHHALSRYHGTPARFVRPSVTVGERLLAVVHSLSSV